MTPYRVVASLPTFRHVKESRLVSTHATIGEFTIDSCDTYIGDLAPGTPRVCACGAYSIIFQPRGSGTRGASR